MTIRPLGDRILIKAIATEEKTVGGVIIPDSAKEGPAKGEVLAVGPGTHDEKVTLQVGDIIFYGRYSGTEIKHEGESYLVLHEHEVLAKLG